MSQEARNVMDDLSKSVELQHSFWMIFKGLSALGYQAAYDKHSGALKKTREAVELDDKRFLQLFSLIWTITIFGLDPLLGAAQAGLGSWIGKLVGVQVEAAGKTATEASEDLVGEFFKKTYDTLTEKGKELVKDTLFEKESDGSRQWEPFADKPDTYERKMDVMLWRLKAQIQANLNPLVTRAEHSWSRAEAEIFSYSFQRSCPYFTDLPDDLSDAFGAKVQVVSELMMWVAWARAQDEKWWRDQPRDDGNRMLNWDHVLDRLLALHVPPLDVMSYYRVGDAFLNRGAQLLDVVKFIEWAKRNEPQKVYTPKELSAALKLLRGSVDYPLACFGESSSLSHR
jgi:hypothetical protein